MDYQHGWSFPGSWGYLWENLGGGWGYAIATTQNFQADQISFLDRLMKRLYFQNNLIDYQFHMNGFERAKDWQSEIGKSMVG